jgi:hypothetical protein
MMTIGGPVLFLPGSLLAHYFPPDAPGLCKTADEATRKLGQLLHGDPALVNEIVASQEPVRARYAPEFVRPIFDRVFTDLLSAPRQSAPRPRVAITIDEVERGKAHAPVALLLHLPRRRGAAGQRKRRSGVAIPASARAAVEDEVRQGREILITCHREHMGKFHAFFSMARREGRVRLIGLDRGERYSPSEDGPEDAFSTELNRRINRNSGPCDSVLTVARFLETRVLVPLRTSADARRKTTSGGRRYLALLSFVVTKALTIVLGQAIALLQEANRVWAQTLLFAYSWALRLLVLRRLSKTGATIMIPAGGNLPESILLGSRVRILRDRK